MPIFEVGTEIDLDEYITVVHTDKSESKDYKVTCTDEKLTINGHTISSDTFGTYKLVVTSGSKTIKVSVDIRSSYNISIINYLAQLENHSQNYTLLDCHADSTTGKLTYRYSYLHNEKYVAIFNEDNPGQTATSDDGTVSADSTILATLSDGNAYWGVFNTAGKPVYDAGKASFSDYYITGELSVDASSATGTIETADDGSEYESVSAPASFTQSLLNYGYSALPDKEGYGYGVTYLDAVDSNKDGTVDGVQYTTTITASGKVLGYTFGILTAIGTSTNAAIEASTKDVSYVPAAITAPEVVTAFSNINAMATKNQTLTITLNPADSTGKVVDLTATGVDTSTYAYYSMIGITGELSSVSTITADGVLNTLVEKDPGNADADKKVTTSVSAYFNRDGKGYNYSDGTTSALTDVTDVFTIAGVNALTTAPVTAEAINSTEFTSSSSKDGVAHFAGKVGDNDGKTVANKFFEQLFNALPIAFAKTAFGTYLAQATEFNAGDKHALTLYSDYLDIAVNTTSNEISMSVLLYMPIGKANPYILATYAVSGLGTTVNDFSSYVVAPAA